MSDLLDINDNPMYIHKFEVTPDSTPQMMFVFSSFRLRSASEPYQWGAEDQVARLRGLGVRTRERTKRHIN
jgi:hypothetical protein